MRGYNIIRAGCKIDADACQHSQKDIHHDLRNLFSCWPFLPSLPISQLQMYFRFSNWFTNLFSSLTISFFFSAFLALRVLISALTLPIMLAIFLEPSALADFSSSSHIEFSSLFSKPGDMSSELQTVRPMVTEPSGSLGSSLKMWYYLVLGLIVVVAVVITGAGGGSMMPPIGLMPGFMIGTTGAGGTSAKGMFTVGFYYFYFSRFFFDFLLRERERSEDDELELDDEEDDLSRQFFFFLSLDFFQSLPFFLLFFLSLDYDLSRSLFFFLSPIYLIRDVHLFNKKFMFNKPKYQISKTLNKYHYQGQYKCKADDILSITQYKLSLICWHLSMIQLCWRTGILLILPALRSNSSMLLPSLRPIFRPLKAKASLH